VVRLILFFAGRGSFGPHFTPGLSPSDICLECTSYMSCCVSLNILLHRLLELLLKCQSLREGTYITVFREAFGMKRVRSVFGKSSETLEVDRTQEELEIGSVLVTYRPVHANVTFVEFAVSYIIM
jgi:hypothetical protein